MVYKSSTSSGGMTALCHHQPALSNPTLWNKYNKPDDTFIYRRYSHSVYRMAGPASCICMMIWMDAVAKERVTDIYTDGQTFWHYEYIWEGGHQ